MFGFLKDKLKEWVSSAKDKLKTEEAKKEIKVEEKVKPAIPKKKEKLTKQKKSKKSKKAKIEEIPQLNEEVQVATDEDVKRVEEENKEVQKIAEEVEEGKETPDKAVQEIEEEHKKTGQFLDSEESKPATLFKKIGKFFEKKKEPKEAKVEVPSENRLATIPTTSILTKIKSTFIYKITEEDFNELFNDLEMLLLENNVALEVVENIKDKLSKRLVNKEIPKKDLESEIKKELKSSLNEILIDPDDPVEAIEFKKKEKEPFIILFFGINGTGKTTTIAKFAHLLKSKHYSVVLAAADTFRAASIEQISEHAKRLEVPLIKHDYGADPSAVGFDAIKYAKAHKIDVVLIDTAGRMHTKSNLLDEMKKICRVTNPDLKIFVAESIAGNDATEQARVFHEMIDIDGSILTKADVDEKGGTIISVSHATHKPIFYLGTGQEYKDLKLFNKQEYIESLGL